MKRFSQFLCLLLIVSLISALPAYAAEATPRASDFFMSHSCYLWKTSDTQFQVWFDVTAVGMMDKLGVNLIKVQRSTDKVNWTDMQTYTKEDYPTLVNSNTSFKSGHVDYTATSGYYYRAYVEFYAKNSSGYGLYSDYTSSLKM